MLLGLESTDARMNRLARNEIYYRALHPARRSGGAKSSGVTNDQIVELANICIQPDRMGMVLLGDLKGRKLGNDVWSALR